jgi:hypothetical protein
VLQVLIAGMLKKVPEIMLVADDGAEADGFGQLEILESFQEG